MAKRPTYAELEKRIKDLEKLAVTYSQAKASLKKTLEKQPELEEPTSGPDMAMDVLEQEVKGQKPFSFKRNRNPKFSETIGLSCCSRGT